jgi:hypothetical protein
VGGKSRGITPLARLVQWGVAGVDPKIMGIGPAPAIRNALERAGLSQAEVDLFDVNEAFAPQFLAVQKELEPARREGQRERRRDRPRSSRSARRRAHHREPRSTRCAPNKRSASAPPASAEARASPSCSRRSS